MGKVKTILVVPIKISGIAVPIKYFGINFNFQII
jgi:hypothetical protein